MKKKIVKGIKWVTDGKIASALGLPNDVVLDVEDDVKNEDIPDILTDGFGQLIDSIGEIRDEITIEEFDTLKTKRHDLFEKIYNTLKDLLLQKGAVSRQTAIVFDFDGGCAPSLASINFGDDLADCYITRIYTEGNCIYIDLRSYYLGEDTEDVLITEEPNTGDSVLLDIMSYLFAFTDD